MKSVLLGRGRLEKPEFAFLRKAIIILLTAGLLIHTPPIFAQQGESSAEVQDVSEAPVTEDSMFLDDPIRTAEQSQVIGESTGGTGQIPGFSAWNIIRMILVLAVVAAAVYGIVFLLKKSSRRTETTDPYLKVLANTHLGANRYAHIISVGGKAWLVGSSDGGVNLISEITDNEIIDAMLLDDSRKAEQVPGRFPDFVSLLRRFGIKAQAKMPGADEIRKRRDRLRGL